MVKVFNGNRRVTEIVEETLQVDEDGSVSFRASEGKGSGRAIRIPGDQFDEFVSLFNETATRRLTLAEQAAVSTNTETTDEDSSSDEVSDSDVE